MISFRNFNSIKKLDEEFLEEKLVTFGNRAKYGQIVFLAGGAGSGKGFSINKFIDSANFKIRDVDEMKKAWMKYARKTGKYPEIANANLKNPNDVSNLHAFVKSKGTSSKTLDLMLGNANPDRLPNIMFDITAKNPSDITEYLPMLFAAGYKAENVHVVWVLTDFWIAVENNAGRERVVPHEIMVQTHRGAKQTMTGFARNGLPKGVNGSFVVILNNPEETVPWADLKTGNDVKIIKKTSKDLDAAGIYQGSKKTFGKEVTLPQGFTRIILKKAGQPPINSKDLQKQLLSWSVLNTPATIMS